MLFGMLDLSMPITKNVYTAHIQEIATEAKLQAEESITQGRQEVHRLYVMVM